MPFEHPRFLADLKPFDPATGMVIREPIGEGPGYWVGAPGVYLDRNEDVIYLLYRVRRPRGVQPDRGAEVHLAVSKDGIMFEDVWAVQKSDLDTTSIERCAMTQAPNGQYLLYLSYVDPADNRWRTDVVAADRPTQFDVQTREPVFLAEELGVEGVKDPWVISVGGSYWMLLSYATADGPVEEDELHKTADAYNTGLIKSRSGLATSADGIHYDWQGDVLSPSDEGWDSYAARLGCLWYKPPVWIGFYDGSASVKENYEERCGLAVGVDPTRLMRITSRQPWITMPHQSGSIRYLDVLPLEDRTLIYYEAVRPDGSHDLRCKILESEG